MSQYESSKVRITYEKSFVAFLDVLGFKKLVYSKKKKDHKKIEEYFEIVDKTIKSMQYLKDKKQIGVIIISDSIILSMPHEAGGNEKIKNFRNLCVAVGTIQRELAIKDILLRGAISSGNTYFDADNHQIIGPAYARAYQLEVEEAKNPRVIIDTSIIGELGFSSTGELINSLNRNQTYEKWNSNILFCWNQDVDYQGIHIEQDYPLFIDYLSRNKKMGKKELKCIVNNIKKNIYNLDSSIYKKNKWVANYLRTIYFNENEGIENIVNEIINL